MKWYSVKKYKPVLLITCTLLRVANDKGSWFLTLGEYDYAGWCDWESKELIEFDDFKITHFCTPDPVEIEE